MTLPLQELLNDIASTSPWAILLFIFVACAAVRRHLPPKPKRKQNSLTSEPLAAAEASPFAPARPDQKEWPLFRDTLHALGIILSIWVVQWVLSKTLGHDYEVGGVRLHKVLDFGHLAVVFNWLMNCLLGLLRK